MSHGSRRPGRRVVSEEEEEGDVHGEWVVGDVGVQGTSRVRSPRRTPHRRR